MLRLLKQNSPLVLLLILFLVVLLQLETGYGNFDFSNIENLPFLSHFFFKNLLVNKSYWALSAIGMGLTLILTFQITAINAKFGITGKKNFLPAFFTFFLISLIPSSTVLISLLAGAAFLFAAVYSIINAPKPEIAPKKYFNSGLLISIGTLFYSNIFPFSLLIFFSYFTVRSISGREIVASIIGLFTPFFILYSLEFLILDSIDFSFFEQLAFSNTHKDLHLNKIISIIGISIFSIFASFKYIKVIQKLNLEVRKKNSFFLLIGLVSIFIFIVSPAVSYEILLIAALPGAFLFAFFFENPNEKMSIKIAFIVFILLLILGHTTLSIPWIDNLLAGL